MKIRTILFAVFFLGSMDCLAVSESVILFEENFNQTNALANWGRASTQEGRIQLVPSSGEAGDLKVRMDDSVDNATFSANVMTRGVVVPDLQSLVFEFDYDAPNDERHDAEGELETPFDGIVIRSSGGGMAVRSASSFIAGRNSIDLTADFSRNDLSQGNTFTIELHQYDNFSHPYDGISWDNLKLHGMTRQEIVVEPPFELSESDSSFVLPVVYDPPPDTAILLTLESANAPYTQYGSAIYPAGQLVAFLLFPGLDDAVLDGTQDYVLRVSDGGSTSAPFPVTVRDNELAGLTLNLPAEIPELGGSKSGTLTAANFNTASTAFTVHLTSSHPELLNVTSEVLFTPPFGSPTRIFYLTPAVDLHVTGDRVVTITASFGAESISQDIIMREGNSLNPTIIGPLTITEGSTGVLARVELNGLFTTNTIVSLGSSSPRVVPVPSQLTVPAGQQTAYFMVTAPDNTLDEGNAIVMLSALVASVPPAVLQLTAIDNDISAFQIQFSDFVERGRAYATPILAVNRTGTPVVSYGGSAEVILFDSKSATELATLAAGIRFTNGSASVSLTFPVGGAGDSLLVRGTDGTESLLGPFHFFHKISFGANDIVAEPASGKILAVSGVAAINGHLNSLTRIDPADGSLDATIFLGNQPAVLAITDNSQFAFAGLRDSFSVAKIDLTNQTVVSNIVLSSSSVWSGDSFWPDQILTLPGRPNDVIVSQSDVGSTYAAVHAYFNGVLQTSGQSFDEWSMVRGAAPDEFFGYNYTDTGYALHHCRLTATGFETIKRTDSFSGGPFSGFGIRLGGGGNLLIANNGRVVNGSDFSIVRDITFPWPGAANCLEVDLATARVIFAQGNTVAIFDTQVFSPIAQFQLPNVGDIQEIVRYGASGLAFRTANSELVFLDDATLIPSGQPVDLQVNLRCDVELATLNVPHHYTLQVTNASDKVAKDVTLRLRLGAGQHFSFATSNLVTGSTQEVAYVLGNLAPGASASFQVEAIPERLTLLVATAAVTSSSLDENYANDSAVNALNVGFESAPNSLLILELPTADVKLRSPTGDLVVAAASDAPSSIADSLLTLNPLDGRISHPIKLPGSVVKLALSDDGSTAYALGKNRDVVYRVSLVAHAVQATYSFAGLWIDDFEVLKGTTDSIVLGSGWDGVRVYDNGVLRPNTSGTYNGDQVELLPDPALVFGYNTEHTGFESYKFLITSQGIQTQVEKGGLFAGFSNDIESDGYYIYSPNGTAARADLMAVAGTFDLNSAFGNTYYSGVTGLEPERDLQRVYFARGNRLISFDSESYLKVRAVTFASLPPARSLGRLLRWGSDGFAAILDNSQLAIIRSDIVPTEPSPIDFIVSPANGTAVSQSPILMYGSAYSGQGIQSITVNGQVIAPGSGYSGWTALIDLVPGTNQLTFQVTPFAGSAVARNVTLLYYLPITQILEASALSLLGTATLPAGWESRDDDHDGYTLRDEILFGMKHTAADEPLLMRTVKTGAAGGGTFAYRRLKSLRAAYTLKFSADLKSWSDSHTAVSYLGVPVTVADNPDYEDVYFQVQTAQQSKLFFQLVVVGN